MSRTTLLATPARFETKAAGEDESLDPGEVVDRIDKSFQEFKATHTGALEKQQRQLDGLEMKIARLRLGGGGGDETGSPREVKEALGKFARTGDDSEIKAMSVGSDPDGGYSVVPTLSQTINRIATDRSPFRRLARVVELGTGDAWEEMMNTDNAAAAWVGEHGARTATASPTLRKLSIPLRESYAAPQITQRLLDDSFVNIGAWLEERMGEGFGLLEEAAFFVGASPDRPAGLLTLPTAATADATRAWGTFEHVASGASGAFPTSNPADKLLALTDTLKVEYQQNASWLMARNTAGRVRQMKDGMGNYIWERSLQQGQPSMLLGFPVALAEDMPAIGADSLSIGFGDWKRCYTIVDRPGMKLLRDPFTAKPNVVFYSYRRVGGSVADTHAAKWLKFAAA